MVSQATEDRATLFPESLEKVGDIRYYSIRSLRPSPENNTLYHKCRVTDPDIQDLVKNILENGILTPLHITRDLWILSGHRRFTAARAAGLKKVPCIVLDIRRKGNRDAFTKALAAFNRGQREKSVDELLREEIVSISKEDAYAELRQCKATRARIDTGGVQVISLGKRKKRYQFSEEKQPLVDAIRKVVISLKDYWPLSDRRIHYNLLNDPPMRNTKQKIPYVNDKKSYDDLTGVLTRMRCHDHIPMDSIGDDTRPVTIWKTYDGPKTFIREQLDTFLAGYDRNLLVSQPNWVEVVAEKLTVEPIVRPVASDYCLPLTIGRGNCSLPPRYHMARRFFNSGKEKLVLLIASDFDPDGECIAESFARSMRDDFGIPDERLCPIKVALTYQQTQELALPVNQGYQKPKTGSSNYQAFVKKYGHVPVYELEALPPETFQDLLRSQIETVLDMEAFDIEQDREREDASELNRAKQKLALALQEELTGADDPQDFDDQ
ncbi:MAG TPA: ParB N-terminal domain-containing protein [Thermoguttaceae bacterium]|nr:ParB N-terminal domain-containing protein [Thermoguttaceae bacterium]